MCRYVVGGGDYTQRVWGPKGTDRDTAVWMGKAVSQSVCAVSFDETLELVQPAGPFYFRFSHAYPCFTPLLL